MDIISFLHDVFDGAVNAADPALSLPEAIQNAGIDPTKTYTVIGAGKASAAMAAALETVIPPENLKGIVVTRYGYSAECQSIRIVEAAHPVPDNLGRQAAEEIVNLLKSCGKDDHVIALISGGGSALLSKPAPCLSFEEKQDINLALLRSGASIHEMNTVRKHLSAVKGGRLLEVAKPAQVTSFIISDVTGDANDAVASGLTVPDPSTLAEAKSVLDKYNIQVSDEIKAYLDDPENETPKGKGKDIHLIGTGAMSLGAAEVLLKQNGFDVVNLGDGVEGDAEETARQHIAQLKTMTLKGKPVALISGGETTVKVTGNGRGGRNAHYILSAMIAADGDPQIYGLAGDTDGIDGSEDNAGAFFSPHSLSEVGRDRAQQALENTDSYGLFKAADLLVMTGPTCTNVNDFRILVKIPQ